ncbi:MAG: PQQ-dependent sugar dehydrogenase [Chitinophagaceae bacterium]
MNKPFILLFFFSIYQLSFSQTTPKLVDQSIQLNDHLSFDLKVPQGYRIGIAVKGLDRPRFFTKSPDGRLFITDMRNRSDNKIGKVLILQNWNSKEKKFDLVTTFLENLHNPNQVAFYAIGNDYYIYVAETGKLSRYKYTPGSNQPSSAPVIIATFPDYGLDYKYGGWHLTRSISFHNNKLYVTVGSSCDACIEQEEVRATILEMDPDGSNKKYYARGLRNAVGMKWVGNELWVTNMGRDNLGPDKPEDLFHTIRQGAYYGWPYYFQFRKQILADTHFTDSVRPTYVAKPPVAPVGFKAHSAPLGFDFFKNFSDSLFNNSFLVALHGSTSVWRQRGNAVVQILPNGNYRDIVTGFLQGKTENKRFGRPCDVLQWDQSSFFISDDKNGVIYYVWKEGM